MRRFLVLVPLVACSITESQFRDEFPATFCTYAVPCAEDLPPGENDTGVIDEGTCEAEFADYIDTLQADDGCTFDADAAQKCLDSLDGAACSDAENVRDDCEGVFSGDGCDLHLDALL